MGRLTKHSNEIIRERAISILRRLGGKNGLSDGDLAVITEFLVIERVGNRKLKEYEDLEEHGMAPGQPCRPGDYALLSNGSVLPVIYVTYTQDDVEVGCQNGIRVSMRGRGPYSCAGFYRTRREAEEARERMGK